MSVNLKKNEKAILAAYQDVLNDKTDTNWLVHHAITAGQRGHVHVLYMCVHVVLLRV